MQWVLDDLAVLTPQWAPESAAGRETGEPNPCATYWSRQGTASDLNFEGQYRGVHPPRCRQKVLVQRIIKNIERDGRCFQRAVPHGVCDGALATLGPVFILSSCRRGGGGEGEGGEEEEEGRHAILQLAPNH